MTSSRRCVFCQQDQASYGFSTSSRIKVEFDVWRCSQCGCWFLDPEPSGDQLAQAYQDDYYGEGAAKFWGPIERLVQRFRQARARRVSQFVASPAVVLDVGCGNGQFLAQLLERGFQAVGVELEGRAAQRAQAVPGLDLRLGPFSSQDFGTQQFDAITLWHVLEHLPDPALVLDQICKLLNDKGHLFLSLPNAASWQARVFLDHWFHLDPPRHLFIPTAAGLQAALEQRGFAIQQITHWSFEQNPFGFLQSLFNSMGGERDALYEQLKDSQGSIRSRVLLGLGALPAIAWSSLESLARHGATIELVAQKK